MTFHETVGFRFRFGFKKIRIDMDSAGFGFKVPGFGFRFNMPRFAHHWVRSLIIWGGGVKITKIDLEGLSEKMKRLAKQKLTW